MCIRDSSNITEMQQGKPALKAVVDEATLFTAKNVSDFAYTLSAESQMAVIGLKSAVFQNTTVIIENIGRTIEQFFNTKQNSLHDLKALEELFPKNVSIEQNKFNTVADFVDFIVKFAKQRDMNLASDDLVAILNNEKQLDVIVEIDGEEAIDWSPVISKGMGKVVDYMTNSRKWYHFLNFLYEKLSEYSVQINRSQYNSTNLIEEIEQHESETAAGEIPLSQIKNIKPFLKNIDSASIAFEAIEAINVTKRQLSVMKEVLNTTLNYVDFVARCEEDRITARGRFIFMSQIVNFSSECKGRKFIEILALEKFFVDADLKRTSEKVQFAAIAPTWEIVGSFSIRLDGRNGKDHDPDKATKESENGLAGRPGDSAGHFLGIAASYKKVAESALLTISASGGDGGKGQDGGDGRDGTAESKPPPSDPKCNAYNYGYIDTIIANAWPGYKFTDVKYIKDEPKTFGIMSLCVSKIYSLVVHGNQPDSGVQGTNGGDGGKSGAGGHFGNISIISVNSQSTIPSIKITKNNDGKRGGKGIGGKRGLSVYHEKNVVVDSLAICQDYFQGYYFCEVSGTHISDGGFIYTGNDGQDGKDDNSTKEYKDADVVPFDKGYTAVNNLKTFARENLYGNLRQSALEDFLTLIYNDTAVRGMYNVSGFLDEFFSLESHYYKLRSLVDFTPFYRSLLDEILYYSRINQLTMEHKKVLLLIHNHYE